MTKAAALQAWFEQFLPAYTTANVPEDVVFPYLTYELVTDAWNGDEGTAALTVNLWFYTESEKVPNAKAQALSAALGIDGVRLRCDEGFIWLQRGSPFCQSIRDDTDSKINRRYINITAKYFTFA